MQPGRKQLLIRALAAAVLAAVAALLSVVAFACDDENDDATNSGRNTPEATGAETGEPEPTGQIDPEDATATAEFIATAVEGIRKVPVIDAELAAGWTEEGEPGETLAALCPPTGLPDEPFAQGTSRLLTRDGERARSSAVFFAEQALTLPYAQQVFAAASACAGQLVQSWFGETVQFGPGVPEEGVGEQATLVESSGGTPAAVLFFKVEEAVGAVAVIGGDSAASARDLAALLAPVIDEHLSGGRLGE
ncbi:MAG: hypothetical protein U1B78_04620 [Dehalococcoidia bacterium]|nr:hypothetical protein [Dehalococcoidia bacterium]